MDRFCVCYLSLTLRRRRMCSDTVVIPVVLADVSETSRRVPAVKVEILLHPPNLIPTSTCQHRINRSLFLHREPHNSYDPASHTYRSARGETRTQIRAALCLQRLCNQLQPMDCVDFLISPRSSSFDSALNHRTNTASNEETFLAPRRWLIVCWSTHTVLESISRGVFGEPTLEKCRASSPAPAGLGWSQLGFYQPDAALAAFSDGLVESVLEFSTFGLA